jgi:hypothetical protein
VVKSVSHLLSVTMISAGARRVCQTSCVSSRPNNYLAQYPLLPLDDALAHTLEAIVDIACRHGLCAISAARLSSDNNVSTP